MPIAKVWNDNVYLYEEEFKGDKIVIEPGGFVEMDLDDAHLFLGGFKAITKRGDGTPDPRTFKKLRIDCPEGAKSVEKKLICHADGRVASTLDELAEMLNEKKHMRVQDEEAEKWAAEKLVMRGEIDELKISMSSQIAELKDMVSSLVSAQVGPRRKRIPGESQRAGEVPDFEEGIT